MAEAEEFPESFLKLSRVVEFARETVYNMALAVEEPLTEIVRYISDLETDSTSFVKLRSLMLINERRCLAAEELKDFVSLCSVDLQFVEHWELNTPAILAVSLDFSLLMRLHLLPKLVAGEH